MKKIIFTNVLISLLILGNPCYISSQSVGVSGQGLIPNASALLDVDASGMTPKGVLIPRITLASSTDATTINAPATSLLVYNTGTSGLSPAGYYYNQGTTVAPNWALMLTNNGVATVWSVTGNTATAASNAAYGATVNNNFVGTKDAIDFVFATNNLERMRITSTGQIGIGTQTPATKLELKDVANTELIRLNNSTNSTTSGFYSGSGNPEGVVTANMASIFADQANGKIYKKSTGSGNTGWNEMVGTTSHMAKMTRDAAQSVLINTWTKIDFDNVEFSVGNIADITNHQFKISRAGKYLITAYIRFDLGSNYNYGTIVKNGVYVAASTLSTSAGGGGDKGMLAMEIIDLAVNDVIEWWVFQEGGNPVNTSTTLGLKPRMSVIELSGTLAGDVVGPASSTDNAIVRFDGTSGKTLQNSGVIIDDANNVSGVVSLEVGGSLKLKTTTITGSTTLTAAHNVILADPTGDITITLPLASASTDKIYYIKKVDASGDVVTIDGNGAETIDLATTIQLYEQFDYVRIVCDGAKWHIVDGFHEVSPKVSEGRLTLTSNTAVTTADVTAATTVYFTPYTGNEIAIFDGSKWYMRKLSQISVAIPGTTDKNFDIFIYDNAGVLALETVDWTDNTNRATAIVLQDGVYVKSGTVTKRYLGTCRTTTVSGQTEDSATKRFVWNNNNRVLKTLISKETADFWTYNSSTWRQANGNTANQVEVVVGATAESIDLLASVIITHDGCVGIGVNSTSVLSSTVGYYSSAFGNYGNVSTRYLEVPRLGYSYYTWLERLNSIGSVTAMGDNGNAPQWGTPGINGSFLC